MAFTVFLWLGVTIAHFWQTTRATRVLLSADATLDDRIFTSGLGGVVALSMVLHTLALTVGISLWSGLAGLALWHAFVAVIVVPRFRRNVASNPSASATFIERVALMVVLGIVTSWIATAAASTDLHGPDVAHYHVPAALNLAAGDSPFDLPTTPHLYPLAGSVIAAWFIVPTGTPLLVDLAMALPFVLVVAGLNLTFRALTGLSGTGWASWLGLVLFSTPLFRSASAGAADLWFAAGFICVVAIALRAWSRQKWTRVDLWLLGAALGLLVGSKTTGVAAAGLLMAAAVAAGVLRRLTGGPRVERESFGLVAGFLPAIVLIVAGGGVWLIRNWIQFGSPLAPAGLQLFGLTVFDGETHQRTTYFSVLGEMQTAGFALGSRGAFYIRKWLGAGFLPALGLIGLLVLDLALTVARRRTEARWWVRTGGLLVVTGSGAVLIWMLIGAPWSALERSGGLTLRYSLPVPALLGVFAFAALFPLRAPWYQRVDARALVMLIVAAVGVWIFWRVAASSGGPSALPSIGIGSLGVGALIVFPLAGSHLLRRGRLRLYTSIAVPAIFVGVFAARIVAADASERARASDAISKEDADFGAGVMPASSWRAVFLGIRREEWSRGAACRSRRVFSLTRNDEPIALQPPDYSSRVYYAGRDVEAARRAGPVGRCDYVISTDALVQTDKGRALVDALAAGNRLESWSPAPPFVVFRIGER